jgi:hypothetical protein
LIGVFRRNFVRISAVLWASLRSHGFLQFFQADVYFVGRFSRDCPQPLTKLSSDEWNRVCLTTGQSPEDGNRTSFRNVVVLIRVEMQTTYAVQRQNIRIVMFYFLFGSLLP